MVNSQRGRVEVWRGVSGKTVRYVTFCAGKKTMLDTCNGLLGCLNFTETNICMNILRNIFVFLCRFYNNVK